MEKKKEKIFGSTFLDSSSHSDSNRYIMEWIEDNPQPVLNNTTKDLAALMFVSQPTLTRFAQKIGFLSFRELQIYVAKRVTEINNLPTKIKVGPELTVSEIVQNVHTYYEYSIKKTVEAYGRNCNSIAEYAKDLLSCEKHIVFGIGNSGMVGEYYAQNLNKIGIFTMAINSIHDFLGFNYLLDKKTHVTLISKSFDTLEICKVRDILEKNNIDYTIWTKSAKLDRKKAKYMILYDSLNQENRVSAIGSKISSFFLADVVFFYLIFKVDPDLENFYQINNEIKKWNLTK
ncbi:MurR/RpiR family transcriptional regulator [Mycoplasmopsis alligatoris]|uniref:Transcriptional regulator, RpiR family n=1 Tax=Mycoplasmopsis alligatoris A21JP2 TaxID=747682 RepID=D4XW24_9BACT|nr:MurR/RpiR family transcriptional regulator [Mycoplasmopsis alligatoris]EFF41445.1 transcriptional regulator, RpiR family [Mycoplasmopsis alligatoris A21JP2]